MMFSKLGGLNVFSIYCSFNVQVYGNITPSSRGRSVYIYIYLFVSPHSINKVKFQTQTSQLYVYYILVDKQVILLSLFTIHAYFIISIQKMHNYNEITHNPVTLKYHSWHFDVSLCYSFTSFTYYGVYYIYCLISKNSFFVLNRERESVCACV